MLLCAGCGGGGGSLNADLSIEQPADSARGENPVVLAAPDVEVPDGVDPDVYRMLSAALAAMLEELPEERLTAGLPEGNQANVRDLTTNKRYSTSYQLNWSYANAGDYDQNTIVTGSDITMVGRYFGAYEGDENWPEARFADGNNDGAITVADLTAIGANYGSYVKGYNIYRSADYLDHPAYNGGANGSGAQLIETKIESGTTAEGVRSYFHNLDGPYDSYYYWVVPTDGENEGKPSNLTGDNLDEWPLVESITPVNGLPGTTVTICGSNFGESQETGALELNGLALEIDSWSDTEISARIPEGADDGMIRVNVDFMFADSPEFVVAAAPVVESCDPYLEFGRPFSVIGNGFRNRQGTGLLFIDDQVHPVTEWSDASLDAGYLDPQRMVCDVVEVQVLASNGLASEPVYVSGNFVSGTVSAAPETGYATISRSQTGTEFTLNYEMSDGSDNYTIRLYPDYLESDNLVEDADPDTPGLQFTYSELHPTNPNLDKEPTFDSHRSKYQTALELTNTDTGHTFTVAGPVLVVTSPEYVRPLLVDVYPLSFNRDGDPAPNDICYLPANDSFLDITFIDGEPYFTSSLADLTDGAGNPLNSYQHDPREYLKDGSSPRPYCYRYSNTLMDYEVDTHNDSSVMSLTGDSFGDEPVSQAFSVGSSVVSLSDLFGWDGNDGWTDTEIRFSIGNSFSWTRGMLEHESRNEYNDQDNFLFVYCSPVVYEVRPADHQATLRDGLIYMQLSSLPSNEYTSWFGGDNLTVWRVPVTYTSPWTGETVTANELLVRPIGFETARDSKIYLKTADLDPDGDGLVTVEARNSDDTEAQILDAALVPGEASFFIWAGIMDAGSLSEIAHSGIYSETYTFQLVDGGLDNQPPVADLLCPTDGLDAPVEMIITAQDSTDPDGTIVDYEWDFDGDGVFNEDWDDTGYWTEEAYRGRKSMIDVFTHAGEYSFTVRVTDDRGATATSTCEFTVVDDYADYILTLTVWNNGGYDDIAATGVEVFRGESAADIELVDSFSIDHSELNGMTGSRQFPVLLEGLPKGLYWFRLTNPDVDWRNAAEAQTEPHPEFMSFGPYTVPDGVYNTLTVSGYTWQ